LSMDLIDLQAPHRPDHASQMLTNLLLVDKRSLPFSSCNLLVGRNLDCLYLP
jgi:hypothetical protein